MANNIKFVVKKLFLILSMVVICSASGALELTPRESNVAAGLAAFVEANMGLDPESAAASCVIAKIFKSFMTDEQKKNTSQCMVNIIKKNSNYGAIDKEGRVIKYSKMLAGGCAENALEMRSLVAQSILQSCI